MFEYEYEVELEEITDVDDEWLSNESLLEMETTYENLLSIEAVIALNVMWMIPVLVIFTNIILSSYIRDTIWLPFTILLVAVISILSIIFNKLVVGMGSYFCSLLTKIDCCEQISEIEGLFSEKAQEEIIGVVKQDLVKANLLLLGENISKKELKKNKRLVKVIKNQIKYVKSVDDKKSIVRGIFELNRLRKGLCKMIVKYQPKVVIQEQEVEKLSLVKSL